MTNYFDNDGEIFIKLYKEVDNELKYWETWNTTKKQATYHWGIVGTTGEHKDIKNKSVEEFRNQLNSLINQKVDQGYKEIPYEDQFTLLVTFKLKTWGTVQDLTKREEIRNILNEHLGWTGNGDCSDGDIGSGEMTLYADVIKPKIAIETIKKEFKDKNIGDDYRFTIMQGEQVIERLSE